MLFRLLISKHRSVSSLISASRSPVLRFRRGIPAAEPRRLFSTCIAATRLFSTVADDIAGSGGIQLPRPSLETKRNELNPEMSTVADDIARSGGIQLPRPSLETKRNDLNPEMLLPGCDFKHWLVFVDEPAEGTSRDDVINSYIAILAKVVGSEEEARMKIYSVSTKHYYAFGCLISKELSEKMNNLPGIRWVLPDSYLHPKTKDYGGEPFIDGKAAPYDPKYHEVWLRNNQNPDNRGRRNPRRNFDRPSNNWQNHDRAPPLRQGSRGFENQPGGRGGAVPARSQNRQGVDLMPEQELPTGRQS